MDERRLKDERFYIRIDIGFWDNPKAIAAGPDGRNLYLCAVGWSRGQLTDGGIPATALPLLAFKTGLPVDVAQAATDKLVEVGMWERTPDGWVIHDYAEHQLTRADIDTVRSAWRQRKNNERDRKKGHADVTRDNGVSHARVTPPESESESESETESEKKSSSSSGPLTVASNTPTTDDDDRISEALERLGNADHHKAIADGVPVRNKPGHLAECIRRREPDRPAARRLALEHPDWDAGQIAQHIQDPDAAKKAAAKARVDQALDKNRKR